MFQKVALVLVGLLIVLTVNITVFDKEDKVEAHHAGDFFLDIIPRSYFVLMNRMEETDVWLYSYEQRCNDANIRNEIVLAMLDTQNRYDVPHVLVNKGSPRDVWNNISTCGTEFSAKCGGGFAVACVGAEGERYPRNCDAFYNGVYMATFVSVENKKSVVKHEVKHCQDARREGYNDINYNCDPVPPNTFVDSIMGCGPRHSLDYTARDDWDWWILHFPPPLSEAGNSSFYGVYAQNNQTFVYYCATSVNANRVFLYYTDTVANVNHEWSGSRLQAAPNTCRNVPVPSGRCYWLKQTNAVADLRYANQVLAGCG
jgi:hypothetical protein